MEDEEEPKKQFVGGFDDMNDEDYFFGDDYSVSESEESVSSESDGEDDGERDVLREEDHNKNDEFVVEEDEVSSQDSAREEYSAGNNEKIHFMCGDVQEAMARLREYELRTTTRFSAYKNTKDFGNTDIYTKKHKIYWEWEGIPYNGSPFIIMSSKRMDCHHGPDRNVKHKMKYKEEKEKRSASKSDHTYNNKKYLMIQDSKKFDCPAKVIMQEIIQFPDYQANSNSNKIATFKRNTSKILREKLAEKNVGNHERRILLSIDDVGCHKYHPMGKTQNISQKIDPQISAKIEGYVREGITSVREMRRLIKIAVAEMFGKENLPPSNSRRFYPSIPIIRSKMDKTKQKLRYSMIDQECLQIKIEEWKKAKPSTDIFYRPKKEDDEGKPFLFVYQEAWQKDLLKRYGDEIILLDATHKTTRYAIPLFFLVVKTNIDYQIVATFVTENESFEAILEALQTIKSWNPSLKPLFAMTDYCNEEINSLECVFPGCEVLICDFHREQAWGRWLKATKNGCSSRKEDILPRLRRIARSQTIKDMEEAIVSLRNSEFWEKDQFSNLREYIENYWLEIKERWVWAYRKDRFLVNINTNNGVERQNESFKYSYLQRFKNSSLTGMLSILVEEFLPDKLRKYSEVNFTMDSRYRKYNSAIPAFLSNRPHDFIKHCMLKISQANSADLSGIVIKGHGEFVVHSFRDIHQHYEVSFGDEKTMPHCSCPDFNRSKYICKHFFAIFKKYPETWSWEALSLLYKDSPFLTLDIGVEYDESCKTTGNPPNDKDTTENLASEDNHINIEEDDEEEVQEKENDVEQLDDGNNGGNNRNVRYDLMAQGVLTQLLSISHGFDLEENKQLFNALAPILQDAEKKRKKEKNLPVYKKDELKKAKYRSLSLSRKKSSNKRVGEKAEIEKESKYLKIEDTKKDTKKKKKESQDLVEENVGVENITVIDGTFKTEEIIFIASSDDEEIVNTKDDDHFQSLYPLYPRWNLTFKDLQDISEKKMLNDKIVNVLQSLLAKSFPDSKGLQDTVLGTTLAFRHIGTPFLQVLHNGSVHWLAISTVGCQENEVFLLDSLFHRKLNLSIKRQICVILQSQASHIVVKSIPVQQQTGGIDCGLFAIAFLEFIARTGKNPIDVNFDQSQMRNHALKCIKDQRIHPFPTKESKGGRKAVSKEFSLEIFCTCRTIWTPSDKNVKGKEMVECDKCFRWFHRMCLNLPEFTGERIEWDCPECIKRT